MLYTRIWAHPPTGKRFLMNEISATSRFTNTKWPTGIPSHTKEAQMIVAQDIVDGWKDHGNHPIGTTYEIEQVEESKPLLDASIGITKLFERFGWHYEGLF